MPQIMPISWMMLYFFLLFFFLSVMVFMMTFFVCSTKGSVKLFNYSSGFYF